MATWTLIPSLVELRNEFNRLAPGRDKGADGAIGDSAHTSRSDHTPDEQSDYLRDHDADSKNEVHALDVDSSGPWPSTGTQKERFHKIMMRIVAGERAKWLSATDRCRLKYLIWDGWIYSQGNDFRGERYTGTSDPHTSHAHFSGRYDTASERDTRPWGVYVPVPVPKPTPAEEDMSLADETIRISQATADAFYGGVGAGTDKPLGDFLQRQGIWVKRNGDAVANLTTLVVQQSSATAQEIAAALAPLIVLPDDSDLTTEDVEAAVRNVLRAGTDAS